MRVITIVALLALSFLVGCDRTIEMSLASGKRILLNNNYGLHFSNSEYESKKDDFDLKAVYYYFTEDDIKRITGNVHKVPATDRLRVVLYITNKAKNEKYSVNEWFESKKERLNLSLIKETKEFSIYAENLSLNPKFITGYHLIPVDDEFNDIRLSCSTNFDIEFINSNGACTVHNYYTKEIFVKYMIPFTELKKAYSYFDTVNELLDKSITILE